MDDDTLGGDDKVPTLEKGRVNFQKMSEYIAKARSVNKTPSQDNGDIIINSISNYFCTILYEVLAETTNQQPFFENRLQQKSTSRSILYGATKLVDIKPNTANGRSVTSHQVELLIKSDASKTSWRGGGGDGFV